jgi:hypothetical protein
MFVIAAALAIFGAVGAATAAAKAAPRYVRWHHRWTV